MSVQCGIFGLPNVGKSTCLNALSQLVIAEASNYPFCTTKPNRSIVSVPDARLSTLAKIASSQEIVPTTVEFVDIPGLVKNASQGEGLGNQFLSHIREVDALVHVVRCFEDAEIMHVSGKVSPLEDIEVIDMELILADLSWLEKIQKNYQKVAKSSSREAKEALDLLSTVEKELNKGISLRRIDWEPDIAEQLKKWGFLTIKPMMYLLNVSEEGFTNNSFVESVQEKACQEKTQAIVSCVKLEADLIVFSAEEKKDLLSLSKGEQMGLGHLIRAAYHLLGLQTFFTAGPKEVRAWTVSVGATAWDAAGCIHSDFQKGFIVAEVVGYDDFIKYQGVKGAKVAGKWRKERKDYVVHDGDVILFQFNVNKAKH